MPYIDGELPPGVTAKDLILAIIGKIGVDGGTGHVIEYRGNAISALSMEQRMTIANMTMVAAGVLMLVALARRTIALQPPRPLVAPWSMELGFAVMVRADLALCTGAVCQFRLRLCNLLFWSAFPFLL